MTRCPSGGERQRAWIAMLIAQGAGALLLDEPASALDLAHQVDVLFTPRGLARSRSATVVLALLEGASSRSSP